MDTGLMRENGLPLDDLLPPDLDAFGTANERLEKLAEKNAGTDQQPEKNNLLMLDLNVLKIALLFIPDDEARQYLTTLRVTVNSGDVMLWASDGVTVYRHTIADYQGLPDVDMLIPKYIVQLALKRARKIKADYVPLDVDNHYMGDIGFKPMPAKYPDFQMNKLMFGEQQDGTTYNVHLLNRLQQAADINRGIGHIMPHLEHYEKCAVLRLDDHSLAVVMASTI
jgi:hypothetical protein